MDCPFCRPEEQRTLETGKHAYVIFSNPRLMPGHLLVIPKRHVEKLEDLSKEEREEILDLLVKYEAKILEKIAAGCDIKQNYRPFMPQSRLKVNHLHFHLQPRTFKDELFEKCQTYEVDVFKDLDDEEVEKFRKLL